MPHNLYTFDGTRVPAPLALHQVVSVAAGGEVVIRLMGYDLDGDDLVATISSVPDSGTLHQVGTTGSDRYNILVVGT